MFKKLTSLSLAIILCLLCCIPALAENIPDIPDGEVAPQYNTVCGNLPYHDMKPKNWGNAILPDGTLYINSGACWQCENCYLVLVTEGDYYLGEMSVIGKWGEVYWYEPVTGIQNYIYVTNWGYCASNSLPGYRFSVEPY